MMNRRWAGCRRRSSSDACELNIVRPGDDQCRRISRIRGCDEDEGRLEEIGSRRRCRTVDEADQTLGVCIIDFNALRIIDKSEWDETRRDETMIGKCDTDQEVARIVSAW